MFGIYKNNSFKQESISIYGYFPFLLIKLIIVKSLLVLIKIQWKQNLFTGSIHYRTNDKGLLVRIPYPYIDDRTHWFSVRGKLNYT